MIEFDALSSRLTVAEVVVVSAPPMRKKTSWISVGVGWPTADGSGVPTETQDRRVAGPASMMRPETFTPMFGGTIRAALPCCGTSVAKPWPSTTVFGRLTMIGCVQVVDAGRQHEVLPRPRARR